ncbi:MAG: Smr/MutS family protein [Rhodobacteraceae bacterium]|nr:Smr/MutS family protein [Paracoccaceae bacterium]
MTRRPTRLSDADRQLWAKVTESIAPLEEKKANLGDLMRSAAPAPQEAAPARLAGQTPPLPADFRLGSRASSGPAARHDPAPSIGDYLARQPVRIDAKTMGKLRRGKHKPEARIDLHGMTLAQAHPALNRFISDSYLRQRRLVLVITGKGKDRDDEGSIMPVPRGVLRHQVPHWLQIPPLGPLVLQILPAHLRHGGDGAYYVYLKRQR